MKIQKLVSVLLSAAMLVSLSACGNGAADQSSGSVAKSASNDDSDSSTTLNFIVQEVDYDHVKEAMEPYLADHKNITVDLVKVADFTALNQKVLAAHQAGDDYDLMFINHVDALAFSKAEILEPLNDYTQKDGIDYSELLYPSLVESCTFDGTLYAVPVNTDTRVMAVNKDLFEQYSQKYPQTQEEMLETAQVMTNDGNYGFVNSMTRSAYVPEYEQGVFLVGNGGSLYTLEGKQAIAQIDTQEMKDYLNFNLELLKYMPKDSLTMSEDDGRKVFTSGNAAMYIFGPWEYSLLPELDFTYELISIPAGTKGTGSTSGGYHMAIGSGSEHKEAAWDLMKALTTSPESMAKVAATALPTMDAAFEIAPYTDAKYDAFREQLKTSSLPQVPVANLGAVVEEFNNYWTDILYGKISVDEACKEAQESVQALLDKN